MKKLLLLLCIFILGFFSAVILSHFKSQPYQFVANTIILKKPIALEVINTQAKLALLLKNKSVIDSEFAEVGSALRNENGTLFLIKKDQFIAEYQIKPISKKEHNQYQTKDFNPNYIGYRIPILVQIIDNEKLLKQVQKNQAIYRYNQASIGAVISQSIDRKYLNLITKETLERDYSTILPLNSYNLQKILTIK